MKHKQTPGGPVPAEVARRQSAMGLFAHSEVDELATGLQNAGLAGIDTVDLRPPQIGLVMVRGRRGGTGKPFNLGEATVTRAAVQTADGLTGVSYILGRAPEKARLAALADALWQSPTHRPAIERSIIEPVRRRLDAERRTRRRQTAATTVDFFTMVRGDD
jgi:alpha-D-ribose 1-methylphosphonate 5-triphosphate synthase subunit PhnG